MSKFTLGYSIHPSFANSKSKSGDFHEFNDSPIFYVLSSSCHIIERESRPPPLPSRSREGAALGKDANLVRGRPACPRSTPQYLRAQRGDSRPGLPPQLRLSLVRRERWAQGPHFYKVVRSVWWSLAKGCKCWPAVTEEEQDEEEDEDDDLPLVLGSL